MKKLILFLLFSMAGYAQTQRATGTVMVWAAPSGTCLANSRMEYYSSANQYWGCVLPAITSLSGTWTQVGSGGGGGGTVTSVDFSTNLGTVTGNPITGSGTITNTVTSAQIAAFLSATSPITLSAGGVIACATCSTATNYWTLTGSDIYNNTAGNIGVGGAPTSAFFGSSIGNLDIVGATRTQNDLDNNGTGAGYYFGTGSNKPYLDYKNSTDATVPNNWCFGDGVAHYWCLSSSTATVGNDVLRLGSGATSGWTSSGDASGTLDTALARNAAGVLEINNGTLNSYRDLKLRDITINSQAGGGTQCAQLDNTGKISGTGGTCGSGSGTVTTVGFTGGLISVGTPTTTPALTVAGTSGGIPYFSSASTWASSGALGANLPVFGGGAGASPIAGTRSGNTTEVATVTGSLTSGNCLKADANGNVVDAGSACGSGSGTVSSIATTSPITGGTITTTGTIACATCLTRSSFYEHDATNYYIGPNMRVATLPVVGNFSKLSSGSSATFAADGDAALLSAPTNGGTNQISAYGFNMSGNTQLTVAFACDTKMIDVQDCGLFLKESGTGKYWTCAIDQRLAGVSWRTKNWSSQTAPTAGAYTGPVFNGLQNVYWARVQQTGGNVICSISLSGDSFTTLVSTAQTTPFTTAADQWGVSANATNLAINVLVYSVAVQ